MALKFYPGQGDYLAQLNNVADITNVYLLGAKAANPTTDNNGNPLVISAVYWNTVAPELRMWTGAVWTAIPTGSYSLAADKDASGGYAGLTGFAINLWNAAKTFKSSLTFSGAANRVHTFQDRDGTIADNTDLARYTPIASSLFSKTDTSTVAFTKTAAGTVSVKAGTAVEVAGVRLTWAVDTAVTMPSLTAGTDYAIYVCTDGSIRADASISAPSGYTTANSRKVGGFHYGLVAAATTVAGGSFATTGNGMIWAQGDVDNIAGINKFSIWDLKFRPRCSDPRGMVLVNGMLWVDIYLCSTDTAANGTSKYNTNIASGTVLPKIPAAFGGNGTTTYPTLNWWVANELARANQKRIMRESEFVDAAFGVTENQSIDATSSTYPTTQRNAGYTSKYGIEEASGHHWIWGEDSNFYSEVASPAGIWKDLNGNTGAAGTGRGQVYTFGTYGLARVLLGGARTFGANSGSRASNWGLSPWHSDWGIGLRAACDHMQLA